MREENEFKGDLIAEEGKVYEYTKITGKVIAHISATVCQFPKLESCGRSAYAASATVCQFPKLESCGGDAYADRATVCQFPNNIKTNDHTASSRCRAALLSSFAAAGFSFADRILARIVSQRGPIAKVIICGQTKVSYVISDDEGNYAHGDPLDEARADLMVKRTSRDLTPFKAWTLEKEVSKSDAILAYRSITGACAKGTRHWLEQRQTPEKITVAGIIEITKGAYGAETFASFFAPKAEIAGAAK